MSDCIHVFFKRCTISNGLKVVIIALPGRYDSVYYKHGTYIISNLSANGG